MIDKGIYRPEISEDGTRQSKRTKVRPVEYWKGEKIVYNRRDSGIGGAGVADVIRVHDEFKPITKSGSKAKKNSKPQKTVTKAQSSISLLSGEQPPVPSELSVINFVTKEEELQSTAL